MTTSFDLSVMLAPMPVVVPFAQNASSNGTHVHSSFGVAIGSAPLGSVVVPLVVLVDVAAPAPPFPPPPVSPPLPAVPFVSAPPPHAASSDVRPRTARSEEERIIEVSTGPRGRSRNRKCFCPRRMNPTTGCIPRRDR